MHCEYHAPALEASAGDRSGKCPAGALPTKYTFARVGSARQMHRMTVNIGI